MSKKPMTEDEFKFVMTKHKDLILFFTSEEELKYENNECGCEPDVPGVLSINIWNDEFVWRYLGGTQKWCCDSSSLRWSL